MHSQHPSHRPGSNAIAAKEAAAPTRGRLLAPALAGTAVLLSAVGISGELLMRDPLIPRTTTPSRQVTDLVKRPSSTPAPAPTEEADGLIERGSATAPVFAEQKRVREADRLEANDLRTAETRILEPSVAGEKLLGQAMKKDDRKDRDGWPDLVFNEPFGGEFEEGLPAPESSVSGREFPKKEALLASAGFDFPGHYQGTDDLQFQPAAGYWANIYVPGDPEIRMLSARLAQWDRSWLDDHASLERAVTPVRQPFDAPLDNALALSVMADASAVSASGDDASRMRLQVGIRGIEHRRGQRPAMNVGVVVDLPADAPVEVRIAARALLDAMLQSKQAGDRFSLVLTASGLVVTADDFRFGSLQLARQYILGEMPPQDENYHGTSALELHGALLRASSLVQQSDEPGRPLGSSSLLLISANSLPNIEKLTALAHQQAREGVTLSVFPLGAEPRIESVEKLVLAGLGNRRFLEAPGQARRLIEEELHASSRAVARAVRLSVRLAPGVHLVDVVGSHRLDTRQIQRVHEIENSMDRRLSTNLGIQADRGEDEDGIQIVIPSIFSGDSVTVLLDVVADRPGAIADVSLRYKDLVFLRNGNLQGHLKLGGGENRRGPGELAVLKNLLSHHFVAFAEQAADALGRQQPAAAVAALSVMRSTIEQARREIPAWAGDQDLNRDVQVLDRYISALASPRASTEHSLLTDSLRYAAWAKTHRPLPEYITRSESNEISD